MYKEVLKWLDYSQRMTIARQHGIKSRRQVYNVVMGKSQNFTLLEALIEKAEQNKKLYERSKQLETKTLQGL